MSLWATSVLSLFLLQIAPPQPEHANLDSAPVTTAEIAKPAAARSEDDQPQPAVALKRDWSFTQAYFDVFAMLSNQNTCSRFYGGPRTATTVLNRLVPLVRSASLLREVSFQMKGRPTVIYDSHTGRSYRIFETTRVNIHGSFYERRIDPMRKFPSDVGNFPPGTRQARALILLHELGHLIPGENGDWLLPDDGFDFLKSQANTLRVQQACRAELQALR